VPCLDVFVFTGLGLLRNCYIYIYALALYAAWFRNYMQSSPLNKVIKDVDFYRCMHGIAECRV